MLVAVLDANVLYPAHLRDVLLWLGIGGFYRPRWSARIHDEWTRNLLANRPALTPAQLAYTRGEMDRAFPDACVEADPLVEARLVLPDPDDGHVVATAVATNARMIVTANLADFPVEVLRAFDVEAVHPDAFVAACMEEDLEGVVATLREHRMRLRCPALSATAYAEHMERAGLSATAALLRSRMDDL